MKKEKSKQTDRLWVFTSNPDLKEILPHFLCPIELYALEHDFKLRNYKIGNKTLLITPQDNRNLLYTAKLRVKFIYDILRSARIEEAKKRDQKIRSFLSSPPDAFKELSNDLKNKLRINNLMRMEQIALMGRDELPYYRRMGKTSAAQLVILFEKYDYRDLI